MGGRTARERDDARKETVGMHRIRNYTKGLAASTIAAALLITSAAGATSQSSHVAKVYALPQKGIDVFVQDFPSMTDAQVTAEGATTMAYIKGLGANIVSIGFPFFQATPTSNAVNAGFGTPTPARLALLVAAAKAKGLQVEIRPLLDEVSLKPGWRGTIAPTSPSAWFASYQAFLAPYLTMAQANKITAVQISNELQSLDPSPLWRGLLTAAKAIYKGEFQFTSNQWPIGMVAPSGSTFGIDLYKSYNLPPTATVAQLQAAMAGAMKVYKTPTTYARTTLAEVGIMAQDGAYTYPANVKLFGPPAPQVLNPMIQVNWFKAACGLARADKMRGIFFWDLRLPGDPTAQPNLPYPARFSTAAIAEIKACFAGK
jgi:hypothetical protein